MSTFGKYQNFEEIGILKKKLILKSKIFPDFQYFIFSEF